MKNVKLYVCLFFLSLSFINIKAQTADEIIKKYYSTIDPQSKLSSLKGIKMLATMNQGIDIPIEFVDMKGGKKYTKLSMQGQNIMGQAFDGTTFWSTNYLTMKPEKLDSESAENLKLSLQDFPDALLDYQSKGYKVEYLAKETKEGTECYKIKLTKKPLTINGEKVEDIQFYYFDVDSNILLFNETQVNDGPEKGTLLLSSFSDFQEVEGIFFPYAINYSGQAIKIKEIILNPVVEDKDFAYVGE